MVNRLSYTAVEKYLDCPKSYFFHYISGLREETVGSALIFGNVIDKSLNALLIPGEKSYLDVFHETMQFQEINGVLTDLSITDKVRYSKGDIDRSILSKELQEEYTDETIQELLDRKKLDVLTKEELKAYNRLGYECLKAKGLLILEAYKKQVLPLFKRVISVQKPFSLSNGTDEFIGFIDLIAELQDGRIVIFDHKTSSVTYKEDSVRESKQLATYVISEGQESTLAGFITIQKKMLKKEPRVKIQVIIDNVDNLVIDSTFEMYDKVNTLIKDGEFPRNMDNCKKPWGLCPFYDLCHNKSMKGLVDMGRKYAKADGLKE